MEKKRNCFSPTHSEFKGSRQRSSPDSQGWILALALFLLIVIQGLALASLSLARYQIKSGSAFFHTTSGSHFSLRGTSAPTVTVSRLSAPEGWDQAAFSTEMNETVRGSEQSYSWKIADGGSPGTCSDEVVLASSRPYLVIIIDDSETMNKSSGRDYENDSLYLKRPGGEIVRISQASEIEGSAVGPEGTFFKGSYGNLHMKAPVLGTFTGAMPGWAFSYSLARDLFDSLELGETAIMNTSTGPVQGFTHDYRVLSNALDGLRPVAHEAKIADTLYKATAMFPAACATSRDILLVTSGVAVNDGHLPDEVRDFDGDCNPNDTAVTGEGCHCLDDVAAYARSKGIKVHVIGPDTAFLRNVASKGGGKFLPARECLAPDISFLSQGMIVNDGRELLPMNRQALFDPPWLRKESFTAYRPGVLDPSVLVPCPGPGIQGIALSLAPCGSILYCTTTRNNILRVSMSSGELNWLVSGIGGIALSRGDRIIAGPNLSRQIFCLDGRPEVLWNDKGGTFDASPSSVYLADGTSITARRLDSGVFLAYADTGHAVTCIRYDAGSGSILAGTEDGLIFWYSQDLKPKGIIVTGASEAVRDLRTFIVKKRTYVLAMQGKSISCSTYDALQWAASTDEGMPVSLRVLDQKIYLNVWKEGGPCGGIDTGSSLLVILDAVTGERKTERDLFSGKAFGPAIDFSKKRLVYTSWNGSTHEEDISGLTGVGWTPAGRRILRPDP